MSRSPKVLVGAALAIALLGASAFAQAPGRPGGRPGGPGARPGGPAGPPPMPGLLQPVTAVDVPLAHLQMALQLSQEQAQKIGQIQRAFQQARQELLPPPPGPGNPPPGPDKMKAIQERIRALELEANQRIGALLTPEQREKLGRLLRDTNDFRMVGIPPVAAPRLQLTPEQRKAIADIAERTRQALRPLLEQGPQGDPAAFRQRVEGIRAEAHKRAMGVLTEEQRAIVQQLIQNPPRPPAE